jgi:dolichol-phosphate mannosyltransferase
MVNSDSRAATNRPRAVVVVPTYNERENIARLIPEVLRYPEFDLLVVDDGSPDGTADEVRSAQGLAQHAGRLHLVERESKLGLGTAYVAGFKWAMQRNYTHIIEMDADFSHHPAALPRLLAASRNADLVLGSRYVRGGRIVDWPWHRKLISRAGSIYARSLLNLPVRDLTGGFKCFRRHVLELIDLESVSATGYAFQIELTYRAIQRGFRIVEIPITFADRRVGESKMSRAIVTEAMLRVPLLRLGPTQWPARVPRRSFAPQTAVARSRRVVD